MLIKSIFIVLPLVILSFNSKSSTLEFYSQFWQKQQCDSNCLPKALNEKQKIVLSRPNSGESSTTTWQFENYNAKINWIINEVQKYQAFQIELSDEEGHLFALCSRYELLDLPNFVPVGSCAGLVQSKNSLIGISIFR